MHTATHLLTARQVQNASWTSQAAFLQAATSMDELQAQTRWAAFEADSSDRISFDSEVPQPKFKPPDQATSVARALPVVSAAYR